MVQANVHAEGGTSNVTLYPGTKATGDFSRAEGFGTTASGAVSHVEGQFSVSSGGASHAEGFNTQAGGLGAHAGLKSLFNYPLDLDALKDWRVEALNRVGSIYDAIVLGR